MTIYTALKHGLSPCFQIQHDILIDFLQRLFPRMENVGYCHSFLESWRKQGRICSPDIFDMYFKLFIPKMVSMDLMKNQRRLIKQQLTLINLMN